MAVTLTAISSVPPQWFPFTSLLLFATRGPWLIYIFIYVCTTTTSLFDGIHTIKSAGRPDGTKKHPYMMYPVRILLHYIVMGVSRDKVCVKISRSVVYPTAALLLYQWAWETGSSYQYAGSRNTCQFPSVHAVMCTYTMSCTYTHQSCWITWLTPWITHKESLPKTESGWIHAMQLPRLFGLHVHQKKMDPIKQKMRSFI